MDFKRNTNAETYQKQLQEAFSGAEVIATSELAAFYRGFAPAIPRATVNWRVYELVKDGILFRIGRGKFRLAKTVVASGQQSKVFAPRPTRRMIELSRLIRQRFPFIRYCIWDVNVVGQFTQHLSRADFILLECEAEVCESVFEAVKERYKSKVYLDPTKQMMEQYVHDTPGAILVRRLVSEAPIQTLQAVPTITIEKLLVDLASDEIFDFLRGSELRHVYANALSMYQIIVDRMFRYARRKGQKSELVRKHYESASRTVNGQ